MRRIRFITTFPSQIYEYVCRIVIASQQRQRTQRLKSMIYI